MKLTKRTLTTTALAAALVVTGAACDGNAQDDLDNIEENVEEGVNEVGEELDGEDGEG